MYFDTRNTFSKIVGVRSSNSGYHPKWVYLYGPNLEFVRPCRKVIMAKIDYLNNLENYDTEYLDSFQGSRPIYTHLELKETSFLERHHLKGCSLFFSYFFWSMFIFASFSSSTFCRGFLLLNVSLLVIIYAFPCILSSFSFHSFIIFLFFLFLRCLTYAL